MKFEINPNASYVVENNDLVVLDFNSGDFYTITGFAKDVVLLISENKQLSFEKIYNHFQKVYEEHPEYDIKSSIEAVITELTSTNIINCINDEL